MRHISALVLFVACMSFAASRAQAHCQLPCGVYDDAARFTAMQEHATTIAKCISVITTDGTTTNQMVRAVNVKDEHADKVAEIVTYYFLTQRIKAADAADAAATAAYQQKLALCHAILVAAMKCKQGTDPASVETLRAAISAFEAAYMPKDHGDHGHAH